MQTASDQAKTKIKAEWEKAEQDGRMLKTIEQARGRHHHDQANEEVVGRAEGRPQRINRQRRAVLANIRLALEKLWQPVVAVTEMKLQKVKPESRYGA